MRTLLTHPRRRAFPASVAIVALAVALLGFATVAAQSQGGAGAPAALQTPKSDAPAPTVYFPSQFQIQFREPEPHIQAF